MAILKSAVSPDLLTINTTSKAMNETQYDTNGNSLPLSNYRGSYTVPVKVRFTAAIALGNCSFILRNSSQNGYIAIRNVNLMLAFDGTGAATTTLIALKRIANLQPTALQANTIAIKPVKLANRMNGSTISDCEVSNGAGQVLLSLATTDCNAGITQPSGVTSPNLGSDANTNVALNLNLSIALNQASFCDFENPRIVGSTTSYDLLYDKNYPLILKSGEALAMVHGNATVIGDSYTGYVTWDEYSA